jgi:hypothetical protein
MSFDLDADIVELAPAPTAITAAPLREVAFRANSWLPDEDAMLRCMFYADASVADMAAAIGRPFQGVRARICAIGMRRNSTRPWVPEEDAELIARYGTESAAAISLSMGRGIASIYARAQLLGATDEAAAAYDAWEDAQIIAGYEAGVPVGQIATLIGRPLLGVRSRATILGVRHPHQPPNWTDEEATRALELADEGHRYLAIIEMLAGEGFPRRSKSGFSQRIRRLGYGRGWGRRWTPEEDDLLRKAYRDGSSLTPVRTRLGRSTSSIRWRCGELGLQGTHVNKAGWRTERPWSEEETAILRAEYGKTPNAELARKLDRKWTAVRDRAAHLGIKHGWMRAFTPDEDRAIVIAWHMAISLTHLAGAMSRDPSTIMRRAQRMGYRFSDPNRPVRVSKRPLSGRHAPTLDEILALEDLSK